MHASLRRLRTTLTSEARAHRFAPRPLQEIKASVRVTNKFTKDGVASFGAGFAGPAPVRSLLSMYSERPAEELTLTDFEVSALDRLAGWSPGAP